MAMSQLINQLLKCTVSLQNLEHMYTKGRFADIQLQKVEYHIKIYSP